MGLKYGSLALMSEQPDGPNGQIPRNAFVLAATGRGAAPDLPSESSVPVQVIEMTFRTGVPIVSLNVASELGPAALPREAVDQKLALITVPIRADTDLPIVVGVLTVYRPLEDGLAADVSNDFRIMTMTASLLEQSLRFRRSVARDRKRIFREAGNALKSLQASDFEDEEKQPPLTESLAKVPH